MTETEKQIKKIEKQTVESLKNLGVWKDEFLPNVQRYAETRWEYDLIRTQWMTAGCPIIDLYTNKGGATNQATHPLYAQLQKLRAELTSMENQLGTTPSGLKKIKETELKKQKKASRFEEGLNAIQNKIN